MKLLPRAAVAIVPLSLLAYVLAGPAPAQDRQAPAPADEWIDDGRLRSTIQEGAIALMEAGRAPELASLLPGLEQKTCELELPPAPNLTAGAGGERSLDSERLYELGLESIAMVGSLYKCDRCSEWHVTAATGFFVTPGGALVTNHHVVDQAEHRALVVMTHDGRVFPVTKVLAGDSVADVAIVQVEPVDQLGREAQFKALPLAQRSRIGQRVRVIHHADGRNYTLTEGIVSRRYIDNHRGGSRWLTITADYARGSSGGPLLDESGSVVGIVSSTSSVYYNHDDSGGAQNLQMVWKQCVPVENIRALLE